MCFSDLWVWVSCIVLKVISLESRRDSGVTRGRPAALGPAELTSLDPQPRRRPASGCGNIITIITIIIIKIIAMSISILMTIIIAPLNYFYYSK